MQNVRRIALRGLVLLVAVAPLATAQEREETLIGRRFTSGGFGGPIVKATSVNGEFAVLSGGSGGWIVNHQFIIGGAAYMLQNQGVRTAFTLPSGVRPQLGMEYGGLELQYIHRWSRVAHAAFSVLTGGGKVFYDGYRDSTRLSDEFAAIEPGVGLEVNVTHWLRIVGGASYRFIGGTDVPGVTARDLSGAAAMLSFKFGKF
jgi:hypothetical protein